MIAFALETEHGVRTGMDTAVDHASEVHSQKWKLRIRHGVDKVAHQVPALRFQLVVFAPERYYAGLWSRAGERGDTVTVQTSTINDAPSRQSPFGCFHDGLCAALLKRVNLCAQSKFCPILLNQLCKPRADSRRNQQCQWMEHGCPDKHLTLGSNSCTSEALNFRTSSPLAIPLWKRFSRSGISGCFVATMTLPHTSWAMPCSRQNSTIRRFPSRHNFAFKLPGL